jgi:bifunctional non-homologous end joining protein LigD
MRKSDRAGRIFIDWSQNDRHKTTVAVYSLRGRDRPTVSTPLDWDEVERAAGGAPPEELVFEAPAVLERVRERGDLFAPVLECAQPLPDL